ncbi:hypothetical protein LTR36_006349 [Oleoguttula mirabilis]|uniref:Uncharacterized protein n=1 Tax=Oleoguttula mirabilis TaxID=1507867 RepID=A0AAV9JUX5_9PEZI|nr:hypothetical protein LTR36_006349 [Oleoguttula mirabilis]
MAGGWGGTLMQNETEFMILDGTMVAVAAILLTVAHPGIFFPVMSSKYRNKGVEHQELPPSEEKAGI